MMGTTCTLKKIKATLKPCSSTCRPSLHASWAGVRATLAGPSAVLPKGPGLGPKESMRKKPSCTRPWVTWSQPNTLQIRRAESVRWRIGERLQTSTGQLTIDKMELYFWIFWLVLRGLEIFWFSHYFCESHLFLTVSRTIWATLQCPGKSSCRNFEPCWSCSSLKFLMMAPFMRSNTSTDKDNMLADFFLPFLQMFTVRFSPAPHIVGSVPLTATRRHWMDKGLRKMSVKWTILMDFY